MSKIVVFWDAKSCSLVNECQFFSVNLEAVDYSKSLVPV